MTRGKRANTFPSSLHDPANQFLTYFNDKIHRLHSGLCELPVLEPNICLPPCTYNSRFSSFVTVAEDYIKQIVLMSPTKFCELDPVQTVILKKCLHVLLTPITKIVNLSLGGGYMPDSLKVSQLAPVLKKVSMDPEDMSSFRPISNLQFISKIIERVVSPQLVDYLMENKIYPNLQSAFRKGYSTETALLRVHNDLLEALDSGHQAFLVMLDFSAAFDTIDHQILLDRLESRFGICDTALSWFRSYLTSRIQYVKINGKASVSTPLLQGVPQGSVLGPLLFSLYVSPLEDIFAAHGIDAMIYADDTQLYIILKKHDSDTAIQRLEHCLHDIQAWCLQNKLVLNDGKTEAIYVHSAYAKSCPAPPNVYFGDSLIRIKTEARDLGAIVDENLSLKSHVNSICKTAYIALRNIGMIRKYLDQSTAERLVHAFVTTRLDHCNSLLYGLPQREIEKLQHVQNTAARIVTRSNKRKHITPILKELHWLPIQSRIKFKLGLITFKAVNNLAPSYIRDLLKIHKPSRCLRSASKNLLEEPRTITKTYGDRTFRKAGSVVWNSLPDELRLETSINIFKNKLKTFLFNQVYS